MIGRSFWEIHPGLFFAISLLTGQLVCFSLLFFLLIPLFFTNYLVEKDIKKLFLILVLVLLGFISEKLETLPKLVKPETGIAILHIDSLKKTKTSFSHGYLLNSTLKCFQNEEVTYYNLPVSLFYTKKEEIPTCNRDYFLRGTLIQTEDNRYRLKPEKNSWQQLPNSFSFAKQRYDWKEKISNILKSHLSSNRSIAFLTALSIGESRDYVLPILIGRLGLSHLFAISGLHFSCLLGFLTLFLLPFFKTKVQSFILLIFAIIYSFYLGSSPSLLRAFVSALIALIGMATYNRSTPLNTLGLVFFFLTLFYPQMKYSIGFCLSFLATFSLIVFYPVMDGILSLVIHPRCPNCFSLLSLPSKHIYLFLHIFKKVFSVNLAISLGTLPLLFYYWNSFPLLSLIYNCFFPTLTMLSLFGVLITLTIYALSPKVAQPLFHIVDCYTDKILDLVYYYPKEWAFTIPCTLPFPATILWITIWIYIGLYLASLDQKEQLFY
jgi:competence protein ComEC